MNQENKLKKTDVHIRAMNSDFVLEKPIFSDIFDKDIRRAYIYKKAERIAKALCLISPAFKEIPSFKERVQRAALALIDTAALPPASAATPLSRELLAISSLLSIAAANDTLSAMNADIIVQEAQSLLREIHSYEEPRFMLPEEVSLSGIARSAQKNGGVSNMKRVQTNKVHKVSATVRSQSVKDNNQISGGRTDAILSVIKDKGSVSIKDISTLVRGVSEKTIQRGLAELVRSGIVMKRGERRWSTYSLA